MQIRFFNMIFKIQKNSDHFNSISGLEDNFWVTRDPIVLKGYIIEIAS